MSIAKRVAETIEKLQQGDSEGALIPACVAFAATSRQEHPDKGDGAAFRALVCESMVSIGLIGLKGVIARQIKVPVHHPDLKPDANGHCTLEEVLYKVVRCGLIHEATIADYVEMSPTIFGVNATKYVLPDTLPMGLAVATILSPSNANERLPNATMVQIGRGSFDVNAIWGKRSEVNALVASGKI